MEEKPTEAATPWIWVLLLPYIALLWLPFYNAKEPALLGFPFFYWYQFAWVPLTSLLIYLVYRKVK
ncbi:MAG: DUF3311 domain-containing protein [Aliidongia sp.]